VTAQDVAAQHREALLRAWDDVVEPFLAAAYERGLAYGRAQVVAAVETVHHPAPHQPAATEHPWCVGCYEGAREDRHPCATIAAIAPHADALDKHDAKVAAKALRVCALTHGNEGNAATVYGHHGSPRACIRLRDNGQWVYDPAWEESR